jgi:hypothetical protein
LLPVITEVAAAVATTTAVVAKKRNPRTYVLGFNFKRNYLLKMLRTST